MGKEQNDHVVFAIFSSEDAAKLAIQDLKNSDKANDDIKLGTIGTISKKGNDLKFDVGRKTGGGAKVGAILGVTAAVLSGGITLIPGVVGGAVGGGVLGTFFKKSVNLTKEDIKELGEKLDAGKIAVVVAVNENEVDAIRKQLADSGGQIQSFEVPSEALEEVAQATTEEAAPATMEETASATESSDTASATPTA